MDAFLRGLPKAELHLHIEGTLEPELLFALARKNGVALPFNSVEEAREAYDFHDLQSFLDIYYAGMSVLRTADDFRELTRAYLERAADDGVRHAEVFFDPQAHTDRGVPFETVVEGIELGLEEGRRAGVGSKLIMCFLRHLSAEEAEVALKQAAAHQELITAVGLDSSERDHPPSKFEDVFKRARDQGYRAVAHAGEEGPADYIWQALDLLQVERIDHGVRCLEDHALTERLIAERIPLTVCPLSNVKLRVFDALADHNLHQLLQRGLHVTINSDDPAYFGGYIGENFVQVQEALGLPREDLIQLARYSIEATFLEETERAALLAELDRYVADAGGASAGGTPDA